MTAPMFRVHDALQRQRLLMALDIALDYPHLLERVSKGTFEGDDASLYLLPVFLAGHRDGCYAGRYLGSEDAFDAVYGSGAKQVAARTRARQRRRTKKKAKR